MGIYKIIYKSLSGEKFEIIADPTFVSKKQEGERLIWSLSFQIRPQNSNLKNFFLEFGIDEGLFPSLINHVGMENMEEESFQERYRRILLVRMGVDKVKEALDENVLENKKFILDVHNYPSTYIKDLWKRCKYVQHSEDRIFCNAPFISGVPTNFEECEMCPMPEYFARCKHLIIRGGHFIKEAGLKNFEFECKRNYFVGDPQDCINPPKSCFEPREIESPKLIELEKIIEENAYLSTLLNGIDRINVLTKSKWNKELFTIKTYRILLKFNSSCLNTDDFVEKMLSLFNLLEWMNIKQFPISNPPEKGTINFLEQFLKENYPNSNYKYLIKRMRKISDLRNMVHKGMETTKTVKIMQKYNVENLQDLWKEMLIEFLLSLKELEEIFSQ